MDKTRIRDYIGQLARRDYRRMYLIKSRHHKANKVH